MSGGRARGQMQYLQNVVFLLQSFLDVPCRVLFHSMTSDPRVHGQGWGSRSKSSTSLKCGTSVFTIVHNLTATYQKAFILRQ